MLIVLLWRISLVLDHGGGLGGHNRQIQLFLSVIAILAQPITCWARLFVQPMENGEVVRKLVFSIGFSFGFMELKLHNKGFRLFLKQRENEQRM